MNPGYGFRVGREDDLIILFYRIDNRFISDSVEREMSEQSSSNHTGQAKHSEFEDSAIF